MTKKISHPHGRRRPAGRCERRRFRANRHRLASQMQEKGSVKGSPGASGYAPGQQMQEKGSVKGTTGASGYAPGHATTGSSVKDDDDVKAGASTNTDIDAGGKARVR